MKPAPFTYHRPVTVAEAAARLAEVGDDSKVLAGGQSLVPLLSMRLAAPDHIVDIGALPGLEFVDVSSDAVRVGALVRHTDLEHHLAATETLPLLGQAISYVAHPTIRNRGTVVGSLCHADAAAELPAVLTLLDGHLVAMSSGGERVVPVGDLYLGALETSLRPDELVTSAVFPVPAPGTGTSVVEVSRRNGDYAVCGVVAAVRLADDGTVDDARAVYVSVGATPPLLRLTDAVHGLRPAADGWSAAAETAKQQLVCAGDIHASAEYRRHLAGVLTERALSEAAANAGAAGE